MKNKYFDQTINFSDVEEQIKEFQLACKDYYTRIYSENSYLDKLGDYLDMLATEKANLEQIIEQYAKQRG